MHPGGQIVKNVIVVVADAMCDYLIEKKVGDMYVCPFLHSLAENNIRFSQVYSDGPYTEAALQAFLSGIHSVKGENYKAFLGNTYELCFQEFIDADYKMYITMYDWFLPPISVIESERSGIHIGSCNIFNHRAKNLLYFMKCHKENSMEECIDKHALKYILSHAFSTAEAIFEKLDPLKKFQLGNEVLTTKGIKQVIKSERTNYETNRDTYIDEMCSSGLLPNIFSDLTDASKAFDEEKKDVIRSFYRNNRNKMNGIKAKQFVNNVLNNRVPLDVLLLFIIQLIQGNRKKDSCAKNMIVSYLKRLSNVNFDYNLLQDNNQVIAEDKPSARSLCSRILKAIDEGSSDTNPFFSYIHFMDTHHPFNFLSYDMPDYMDEEFNEEIQLINAMRYGEWKGSFSYLLAAHYVDKCVHDFFDELAGRGLLDDTVFVFTADHGIIYGDSPIRDLSSGANFHYESYHIPCIVVNGKESKKIKDNSYHSSCDIFPTIFSLAKMKSKGLYDGVDMMQLNRTQWTYFSNLGAGTPDIQRGKITYGVRSDSFFVVIRANIHETVKDENVIAVYDTVEDPYEKNNIKDTMMNCKEIKQMVSYINEVHEENKKHVVLK